MFKSIKIGSKKIKEGLRMQSFLESTNEKNRSIKEIKQKDTVKNKKKLSYKEIK